ncbi:hypothetical protein C6V83_01585 [Gordonia iterans]|uniref:Uncharacterized protein n=1 Tax=Gordonia iterans TaxID=1004901 RepID=A0A2S0KBW6_9ACTN|nr:hypothetical protein C6V83_01585 [Gordonia iterans]
MVLGLTVVGLTVVGPRVLGLTGHGAVAPRVWAGVRSTEKADPTGRIEQAYRPVTARHSGSVHPMRPGKVRSTTWQQAR